jgi:hypothetical protein
MNLKQQDRESDIKEDVKEVKRVIGEKGIGDPIDICKDEFSR